MLKQFRMWPGSALFLDPRVNWNWSRWWGAFQQWLCRPFVLIVHHLDFGVGAVGGMSCKWRSCDCWVSDLWLWEMEPPLLVAPVFLRL